MTTAVAAYSPTEAALIDLATKYKGVVYDVTKADGMADAKAARNEIRKHRTTLEAARVKEKAESLAYGKFIDTEAKRIADRIAELEDPIAAMIDAEVNKAKLAEQEAMRVAAERLAAEEAAKRKAEDERIAAANAEISRQQEELRKAQAEVQRKIDEQERASRLKIEEEERKARASREEEDRKARLAQQARDEVARVKAEQEAAALKAERDKLDAAKREAEEIAREVARKANELLDANEMLKSFVSRFGHLKQFKTVVAAIEVALEKEAA